MTRDETIELIKYFPQIGQDIKLNEDIKRTIESGWDLDSVFSDGMPKGNNLSDITSKKGCQMAISGDGDVLRTIDTEIERLRCLQTEIFREFKKLPYYEKQVIYAFYIDGKQWEWVARGMHYSVRQCKRFRNSAINRLRIAFEGNRYIQSIEDEHKKTS